MQVNQLTERQANMFMFLSLLAEAEKYSWVFKDAVNQKVKMRLNQVVVANKALRVELVKLLGTDAMDAFENDSEVWSNVMNTIRQANGVKKQEIYQVITDYLAGNVEIIEDSHLKVG